MDSGLKRRVVAFADRYNNAFLSGRFSHVERVRKYALLLADKEGADKDVVEIAALFHDIGLTVDRDHHEEESARLASAFLAKTDVPERERKMVIECILKHRSSKKTRTRLLEAKIVAAADALAFLEDIRGLQRLFYRLHGEAEADIFDKIERMYGKVTLPSAKPLTEPLYKKSMRYWKAKLQT
ncbi:Ribonuclease Y [uncultured archaeon]|nr:Ribonuclease Y [uncultured archaeon]